MNMVRKLTVSALLFAGTAFASFAADFQTIAQGLYDGTLQKTIDGGLSDFAEELGFSVPQTAVQQNVYAEAFIGTIFPSVPPHFSFGVNAGLTHLNTEGLASAADALGIDGVDTSYYFPVFNADIRIGGIVLPFDIGVSFMKLDVSSLDSMSADFTADFFTFAVDARYAILKDGVVSPALSIGVGYSINRGSFGAASDYADVAIDYDVQTLYAQLQLSKTLNIPVVKIGFTPFIGIRGVLSNYSNDWSWKLKGSGVEQVTDFLKSAGLSPVPATSGKGTASGHFGEFADIQPQIYGGLGFNLVVIQITASISADLRHIGGDTNLWSGAVSLRFKL